MGILRKTKAIKALRNVFAQSELPVTPLELVDRLDNQMSRSSAHRIPKRLENEGMLHSCIGKEGLNVMPYMCQGRSNGFPKDIHPHFH